MIYTTAMSWTTIFAIIVVIVILVIVYKQWIQSRKYTSSLIGYFANQKHIGAIFPLTGESVVLMRNASIANSKDLPIDGYIIVSMNDATGELIPKPFPEFGGRFIVIPALKEKPVTPQGTTSPAVDPNLILYACVKPDELIDPTVTPCLVAVMDEDIKMPVIKLGISTDGTSTWKFIPSVMRPFDRMRKLFGAQTQGNIITEMPTTLPTWVNDYPEFVEALKGITFSGLLKNVRYPELQYPVSATKMKRWGPTGIAFIYEGDTISDPQILLVPTLTAMTFRAYSLKSAVPNKETGYLENYMQLIATNGASFELTKKAIDTDASRWKLVLVK